MAKRGDPGVTRLVVGLLRSDADKTQKEFGEAIGVDQAAISRMEKGELVPSEETLRRMAKVPDWDWPAVVHLQRFIGTARSDVSGQAMPRAEPAEARVERPVLAAARLAMAPYLLEFSGVTRHSSPKEARREAEEVWEALAPLPHLRRQWLLEISVRASRSWAMAERLSHESERAAARSADKALELAELAVFIAERVPGEKSWRSRIQGYCWAFLANARRVANDFDEADKALARAWDLWGEDAGASSTPLAEWRLLDMEASLRREQHRFSEALELLEQARAKSEGADGRILLKKERVLEQMDDIAGAVSALMEAAPFVKDSGDPRLLFSLRFKTVKNLCHLERYTDAAVLLPEVLDLAVEQANELDLIRTQWLRGRVRAGLGQGEEAQSDLEQVQREFTARKLPYDAALTSLDLAVLWLEERRTEEVRVLAVGMAWIFEAQGIQSEALAALSLFHEAALKEAASVDLARRVIAEVEAVRRSAPRSM